MMLKIKGVKNILNGGTFCFGELQLNNKYLVGKTSLGNPPEKSLNVVTTVPTKLSRSVYQ